MPSRLCDTFPFVSLKISSSKHITEILLSHAWHSVSHDKAMTGLRHKESSHCGSTVSYQHAKTDSIGVNGLHATKS